MNAVNIKTVAGCDTRLTVNVTAPEGATTALTGFVRVQGVPQPAQVIEPGVLLLPACEPGEYLYEVRAGESVAAHGHLLVRHSAFPPGGTVDAQIDADLTQCGGVFAVTLTEGARGKQGEDGQPGKDGKDGQDGKDGATPEEVAAELLKTTAVPVNFLTTKDAGGNASFVAAQFPCPATGRLKRVSILCRSTGYMREDPLYFVVGVFGVVGGIKELTRKAVSRNEVAQQHGCRSIWEFDGFDVQRGEMLYMYASLDLSGNSYADMVVGCTVVATNGAEEGQCQGTNGSWFNLLVVAELEIEQEASPVMLTEAQKEKLKTLLAD